MATRIASCKVCGKNAPKQTVDKTASGFIGHINPENGKRWQARVCDECLPDYRKTHYRKNIEVPESIECAGCGITMQPKQRRTTVCSNKCRNRIKRKESRTEQGKQIPIKMTLE